MVILYAKARLLLSCRFWPFSVFTHLQRRQQEESAGLVHMASLFEERALLDLVRGLKTLRGGWKGEQKGIKIKTSSQIIALGSKRYCLP